MADSPAAAAFQDARSDLTPEDRDNNASQNSVVPNRPSTGRRTLFHNAKNSQRDGEEHIDHDGDVVVAAVEEHGTPKYLCKSPDDGGYDSSDVEEEFNDVGDGDSVADSPDCELLDSATTETFQSRLEVLLLNKNISHKKARQINRLFLPKRTHTHIDRYQHHRKHSNFLYYEFF